MTISLRSLMLISFVAIIFLNNRSKVATAFRDGDGRNFVIFERINCSIYPGSKASDAKCLVKYIDWKHIKFNMWVNITKPITAAWIHAVAYFKYSTYQKIATEYWDDICAWIAGKKQSYFLDYFKPLVLKYSNYNHTCPYTGMVFAKSDNASVQQFGLPQIVPAGRYRVNFNITEGLHGNPLFGGSMYFSISDHRIEIV